VIAIGIGVTFAAYTIGMLGYCLLRGYNITFGNLWGQEWPAKAKAAAGTAAGQATV
jgi:hypothetical protein